jgi:multiple sugar transport system permease protein
MADTTLGPNPVMAGPGALSRGRSRRTANWRDSVAALFFAGPNLVLIAIFLVLPLILAFVLSFYAYSGFGDTTWVGLANYRTMISDPVFWRSLVNTGVFALLTVPVGMAIGLGLAVLMNSVLPGRVVWRTMIYLPLVISGVATGLVGNLLFDENIGTVNKILNNIGLGSIHWQSEGAPAFASIVLVTLWIRVGFDMIIYLAGLQGISPELFEAAKVEGASGWQQFRSITVPLVGPSTFFLLIMNVIYAFQIFDTVYIMTDGGPGESTEVLGTLAYKEGFGAAQQQGYAAAIGVVIFLLTLVFTAVQWRANRSRDLAG